MSVLDWIAPKSNKLRPWHGWGHMRTRVGPFGMVQLHPPMWLHIDRHYLAGEYYLRIFVGRVAFVGKIRKRRPGE